MDKIDELHDLLEHLAATSTQQLRSFDRAREMASWSAATYKDERTVYNHVAQTKISFDIEYLYSEGRCCGFMMSDNKEIIIAIRGSKYLEDWMRDFNLKPNISGMHSGFYEHANKLWPFIQNFLYRHQGRKIFVTGHSMGGAVALLIADKINKDPYCDYTYQTYTFGAPCVDQGKLRLETPLFRFRYINDIVPLLLEENMVLMNYYHGESEYVIKEDKSIYELNPPSSFLEKLWRSYGQLWHWLRTDIKARAKLDLISSWLWKEHSIYLYEEKLS